VTEGIYGEFEEDGFVIKAFYGTHNMVLVAYRDGEEVDREECPPYNYEPRFGLDVQDAQILEERTEILMGRLKGKRWTEGS
jgi:hypothetical protein